MFIHLKTNLLLPSTQKDMQECKNVLKKTQIDLLLPSRKSYHFCMKDEMAILRSHTHTQYLKKP